MSPMTETQQAPVFTDLLQEEESPEAEHSSQLIPDEDGVIRWVYEQPMGKSFFLLFEIWRVFAAVGVIMILFTIIITLLSGDSLQSLLSTVGVICGIIAFMMVLSLPAYWIVTKANNGKYTVLFEMDEESVTHTQIKTDKAKALEALTILAGQAAHNRTAAGTGFLQAAGGSLCSEFRNVKTIRAYPEKNTICLNGTLIRNQVYAEEEQFEAVFQYILEHCPNAAIR